MTEACQCDRHGRQRCVRAITQEDLLCDSCREPGCVLTEFDGLLTGHAPACFRPFTQSWVNPEG